MTKKDATKTGFRKIETKANFFKFENQGDTFHGIFLEASERASKQFSNIQTVWTCADMDGEIFQIAEKTTMSTLRHQLKKGDEFQLVYEGEVSSETKGRKPYKTFTLYLKDIE